MDKFSEIAKSGHGGRMELLYKPTPAPFTPVEVPLMEFAAAPEEVHASLPKALPAMPRTKAQLAEALSQARRAYAPFLQECAPALPLLRKQTPLTTFKWNQSGKDELKNVKLPHYGEPLGNAQCSYETNFQCAPTEGNRVYIVLKGADYRAAVFINGALAGTHEGFFAAFEFDITALLLPNGQQNTLRIELSNDYVMLGSKDETGQTCCGDKLYAATGPGYDDAARGWHHCPPGMGLFDRVFLEERAPLFVNDVFTRTLDSEIEVWAEVTSSSYTLQKAILDVSLYGRNHPQTVFQCLRVEPSTGKQIGLGDTFTEVNARRDNTVCAQLPLLCTKGRNLFKILIPRTALKPWCTDAPYLYQLQITVLDGGLKPLDAYAHSFGVRTFTQDETPDAQTGLAGMFRLNGEPVRLRGANTMGFEQQDVMRGDFQQLIDDILLAKLCNMNFLRLTQRPVQQEIYDFCDRLGLMTQTDLPLFGCLRRAQFVEAVRQAGEMERHVRGHACNVLVTYINEPFPNANNAPHINLTRSELAQFFAAADIAVRLENPDRVIKHVDGDYDPPDTTMPDNHCYPLWYNGHGIDAGQLNKGYWMPVKPGWHYGCGEFGCEGLEDESVMLRHYPAHWLPHTPAENAAWRADAIVGAQTESFYHFFFEKQHTLAAWIAESQRFQAFATRFMAEAFRRDTRMVSFAIHLFIDAFPAGWMKTIMDCERNPKPAYFAYRNALAPVLLSLRTDRFAYSSGEVLAVEAWLCNDTARTGPGEIRYALYRAGTDFDTDNSAECTNAAPFAYGTQRAVLTACTAVYAGSPVCVLPEVTQREIFVLQAYFSQDGAVVAANSLSFSVFPSVVDCLPAADSSATPPVTPAHDLRTARLLVRRADAVTALDLAAVKTGAILLIDTPDEGCYTVAGSEITVQASGMSPMYFAARDTMHAWVNGFFPHDFSYFYDARTDCIVPLASCTFTGDAFAPVLTSRNLDESGVWREVMLLGEKTHGKGRIVVSQIPHALLVQNPVGRLLLSHMR